MSSEQNTLSGKRAFVTGGSKGIGAAIVRALCAKGCEVVFAARDEESAQSLCAETSATAVIFDLLNLQETHDIVSANGPFDILVNNAGMDQHAFFTKTTMEEWRYLLTINLEAVFATTHAALPAMQQQGYGRIINVSSEAGRMGSRGGSVYAAAKGGVHAFTKSIARENGRKGITANVVAPGPIDTPLLRAAVETGGDKLLDAMKGATLLSRLGTPEEVAATVVFLVSEEAGFITGEVIGVSGGMGIG
ncbi:SDR family NAD(P)-dependent oxidoreductase [Paraglaciecola agarilytica]|uniref:SDR family NAD(P)-dependent oxidoreductase n=1 Tax=Paraglaciecola chathamensis TaxID=368405 RepID=UPI002355CBCC|nr:SDR family NAD(P)-dependent oxidoreductase [Paraglaciecola agarilytica]|tara:strand:- start:2785 stop:3528 length:744 start_codon:yes stop_codon:yes gene_type:complete